MSNTSTTCRYTLITGGTSGLGLACARSLLANEPGRWRLLLLSRNAESGVKIARDINRELGSDSCEFLPLDLGDLASVRSVGAALRGRGDRVDALICNAGVQFVKESRTAQGFEATFGVNHLGHFLLVGELAPLLQENARVLVVSSGTHDPARRTGMPAPRWLNPAVLAKPEMDHGRVFSGQDDGATVMRRRYTTSKLANLYFAYELDRRIRDGRFPAPRSVIVNAFDPGLMPGTGLAREYPIMLRWVWHHVMPGLRPLIRVFMGPNVHSPRESGSSLAALAAATTFASVTGRYFEGRREIASSDESYDKARASELWDASQILLDEWQPSEDSPRTKASPDAMDRMSTLTTRPGQDAPGSNSPTPTPWRTRAAWALSLVIACVFLLAGAAKLAGVQKLTDDFARWGYPHWFMTFTGIWELTAALLLVVPRYALRGSALAIIVMCGAVITHWTHSEFVRSIPAIVLLLMSVARAAIGVWLRRS